MKEQDDAQDTTHNTKLSLAWMGCVTDRQTKALTHTERCPPSSRASCYPSSIPCTDPPSTHQPTRPPPLTCAYVPPDSIVCTCARLSPQLGQATSDDRCVPPPPTDCAIMLSHAASPRACCSRRLCTSCCTAAGDRDRASRLATCTHRGTAQHGVTQHRTAHLLDEVRGGRKLSSNKLPSAHSSALPLSLNLSAHIRQQHPLLRVLQRATSTTQHTHPHPPPEPSCVQR